jgi:translocation and assembly module TamB
MADNNNTEQPGGPDSAVAPASPRARRWPRRVLISLVVLVALLAGAFWRCQRIAVPPHAHR